MNPLMKGEDENEIKWFGISYSDGVDGGGRRGGVEDAGHIL